MVKRGNFTFSHTDVIEYLPYNLNCFHYLVEVQGIHGYYLNWHQGGIRHIRLQVWMFFTLVPVVTSW